MEPPEEAPRTDLKLAGDTLNTVTTTRYLGYEICNSGVTAKASVERATRARKRINVLRNAGIIGGKLSTIRLIGVCKAFILSTAVYGVHLTPVDHQLYNTWKKLEEEIIIFCMGCFTESRRARLRDIAQLSTLQEIKGMRWSAMANEFKSRASISEANGKGKDDLAMLRVVDQRLGSQRKWSGPEVKERREKDNARRERKLPRPNCLRDIPVMFVREVQLKRAGFHWYCGTFPPNIRDLKLNKIPEGTRALKVMKNLMTKPQWSKGERKKVRETVQILRSLASRQNSSNEAGPIRMGFLPT